MDLKKLSNEQLLEYEIEINKKITLHDTFQHAMKILN